MKTDLRITQYIDKAQPFAQPILNEIRRRIHAYCPEVEEGWKWSFPNFMLNGKILCSMAAFKNHCSFGFWLAALMNNEGFQKEGMGDLGKMTKLEDLPNEDLFKAMLFEAMELTLAGKTIPKAPAAKTGNYSESPELLNALQKNAAAQFAYEKFSNSHRKEYNEWILEAKTEATRDKRIAQAIEWMSEGKHRHWKYVRN
ncbi:MAG: YdeI/OmpD-associated family protein [Bacteroidota bacterium]